MDRTETNESDKITDFPTISIIIIDIKLLYYLIYYIFATHGNHKIFSEFEKNV